MNRVHRCSSARRTMLRSWRGGTSTRAHRIT
uniref:Uncharacterized protein n=1 Tax=Arundo donax TaxID=35708 RepID=A0A0A9C2F0_ARUDO